jgi:hypothetical protein
LTAFSQKGIDSIPDVKCFPISTVKEIIKDLMSGDSAKEVLKLTEKELSKLEEKSHYQDSVINKKEEKIDNLNGVITEERVKYGILEDHTKNLEKALGREKFIGKCTRWISGGAIVLVALIVSIIK